MNYNLYLQVSNGAFNLLNIPHSQVEKVAEVYRKGLKTFTISHQTYKFNEIHEIAIFENAKFSTEEQLKEYAENYTSFGWDLLLDADVLANFGRDVTSDFLEDNVFGYKKVSPEIESRIDNYVNLGRIEELKALNNPDFDLSKLIKICEELNSNWQRRAYFTVGLLLRTIINHVPPIFGDFTNFDQVSANYGGTSFKKNMKFLNESLRSIADGYTHQLIRKKEPLPSDQQVDYKSNLDALLCEIIIKLS